MTLYRFSQVEFPVPLRNSIGNKKVTETSDKNHHCAIEQEITTYGLGNNQKYSLTVHF